MSKWTGSCRGRYCGKQLQCKRGGGYHFATIKDPIGNELRTHKDCVKRATGNGFIEVFADGESAQGTAVL